MRLRGIAFLTLLLMLVPLRGQKNKELKEIWMEAESHYLYGEYELANPLYLMLNELIPGNHNIKYKIGNCYLNIFDEKPKAIPFLEDAVRSTSYDSKTGKLKEKRGLEFARRFRRNISHRDVPIVLITVVGDEPITSSTTARVPGTPRSGT